MSRSEFLTLDDETIAYTFSLRVKLRPVTLGTLKPSESARMHLLIGLPE